MASDASHMLEAALEQMDDIIAGSKSMMEYSNGVRDLGSPVGVSALQVLQLAEELRLALELQDGDDGHEASRSQLPCSTAHALLQWLETGTVNRQPSPNNETYQERLERLEGDKESLVLQVSVLTEQVEAQGEKIKDLEASLEEHHQKLVSTEGMLQQELLSRTSLETQKLDLMDEVSYLKLKLVSMEDNHGHKDPDDKHHKAEGLLQELRVLKSRVEELEKEKSQYERKLKATKVELLEIQQLLSSKDAEIESLQNQLLSRGSSDTSERDLELQRLKLGMESLLVANDEKDRHIEELTALLDQYRTTKDMMMFSPDRLLCVGSSEEDLSGALRGRSFPNKAHSDIVRSNLQISRGTPQLVLSPAYVSNNLESKSSLRMLSSSLEELQTAHKHRHRLISDSSKYRTLPGKFSRPEQNGSRGQHGQSPDESEEGEMNLTKSEKTDESTLSDLSPMSSGMDSGQQSPVSPENKKNQRGIRKLWGKIRRTQSGGSPADGVENSDLRRGGVRATAGPRLTCVGNRDSSRVMNNTPFSKWSCDQVCSWLEDFGLGQYVLMARQWVSGGQTLLSASPHDLEKELGIKHPLHKKKLQLALHSFTTRQHEKSAELDHIWVTRWLDDIGLPQYKDQFHEGRVDGRMLQYLTVNDLLFLKVSSQLHHLSIKCAIHVLYVNRFNPNCLKRRPGVETQTQASPSEVVQWSNHRVMEWLRSVDLAEYAPNLRGSGVHGGLIILEPRFNSDTMAMLLNISPQKTLLRRHLRDTFSCLVGAQAQLEKREYMESPNYTPLSITAKVRPRKIGFSNFSHRKKRPDDGDYICPLDSPQVLTLVGGTQRISAAVQDRVTERREQVGPRQGSI